MNNEISIKKASVINAISKYIKIIIQLGISAILSRILTAEDYGIVAIITVFTTFFSMLSDMGFGTAIIQKKNLTEDDISNIYSFTVYIGIAIGIFFMICSYPISIFYKNSIYIYIGILLSISVFFNAVNMVPKGILMRDKKFVIDGIRTIIVYLFSSILAIIFALLGFKYYALVIQSIIAAFFTFVWNYRSTKPKFKIKFNFFSIKKVMNYSSYQFGFNIINYFSRNLDNLLTGKVLGSNELGYYNKAYNLMLYPVNNLTGVISPILHPLMADFQEKKRCMYKKYIKIVRVLALLGIFISVICYLSATEIITIMYGSQWKSSISCFKYLSMAICTQMITSSAGSIYQSLGKTKLLFINGIINTFITIIAIICGIFIGKSIEMLSLCVCIAYIIHFFTAYYMLIKFAFGYSFIEFVFELKNEFSIAIFLIIAVFLYQIKLNNIIVSFSIKVIYLTIILLISMLVTREYKFIKDLKIFRKR